MDLDELFNVPFLCGRTNMRPTHPDEVAKPIREAIEEIKKKWEEEEKEARKDAAEKQSYDDLAASGGIVDAP